MVILEDWQFALVQPDDTKKYWKLNQRKVKKDNRHQTSTLNAAFSVWEINAGTNLNQLRFILRASLSQKSHRRIEYSQPNVVKSINLKRKYGFKLHSQKPRLRSNWNVKVIPSVNQLSALLRKNVRVWWSAWYSLNGAHALIYYLFTFLKLAGGADSGGFTRHASLKEAF